MLTDNFGLYNLLFSAQMLTHKYASEIHSGGERRQNRNVNLLELGYNESRGNSGSLPGSWCVLAPTCVGGWLPCWAFYISLGPDKAGGLWGHVLPSGDKVGGERVALVQERARPAHVCFTT